MYRHRTVTGNGSESGRDLLRAHRHQGESLLVGVHPCGWQHLPVGCKLLHSLYLMPCRKRRGTPGQVSRRHRSQLQTQKTTHFQAEPSGFDHGIQQDLLRTPRPSRLCPQEVARSPAPPACVQRSARGPVAGVLRWGRHLIRAAERQPRVDLGEQAVLTGLEEGPRYSVEDPMPPRCAVVQALLGKAATPTSAGGVRGQPHPKAKTSGNSSTNFDFIASDSAA